MAGKRRVRVLILLATTTDYEWQSTENRQITKPVIVQPDLSQGYNYTDFDQFDETSAISLRLALQPTGGDWLPK